MTQLDHSYWMTASAFDRRPTNLMVQMSARCNIACAMCGHVGRAPNNGFMSEEVFEAAHFNCRDYGIPQIVFASAWGEPLLNPKTLDFLRRAEGLTRILSTNVTPLVDRTCDALAEIAPEVMQVSFFGWDQESYGSVYRGAKFEQSVSKLTRLVERFRVHAPDSRLQVSAISLENDEAKIRKGLAVLKEIGFLPGEIELKLPNNFGGLNDVTPYSDPFRLHTHKRAILRDDLVLCSVLTESPAVLHDGRVTACGCLDNDGVLELGNILETSLREMRYAERYEQMVQAFLDKDIGDLAMCKDCDIPYGSSRNSHIDVTDLWPAD